MTGRERKLKARLDKRRRAFKCRYKRGTIEWVMMYISWRERQPTPRPNGWRPGRRRLMWHRRPPLLKALEERARTMPMTGRQAIISLDTGAGSYRFRGGASE